MSDRRASRCSSRCLLPGCGKPSSWKDEGWGVRPGQQLQEHRQPQAEVLEETTWPRSHGDRWTRRITAYIGKRKGNVSFPSMDRDDNDTTHRMRAFQQILTHQEGKSENKREERQELEGKMSILRTQRAACPGEGEGFTSESTGPSKGGVTHSESIWGMCTQSPEDGDVTSCATGRKRMAGRDMF